MSEHQTTPATERQRQHIFSTLLNTPIQAPALTVIILASTALWHRASVLLSKVGGKGFAEMPGFWLDAFFCCPFINLVFAIILTKVYVHQPRRHTLLYCFAVIVALSPWLYLAVMNIILSNHPQR